MTARPSTTLAELTAGHPIPCRTSPARQGAAGPSVSPSGPAAESPTVTTSSPALVTGGPAAPPPAERDPSSPLGDRLDVSAGRGRPSIAGPVSRGGDPGQHPTARPVSTYISPPAGRAAPPSIVAVLDLLRRWAAGPLIPAADQTLVDFYAHRLGTGEGLVALLLEWLDAPTPDDEAVGS